MENSLLFYLDRSAERFPDKCAYEDAKKQYTFREMQSTAKTIATALCKRVGGRKRPIAVYMEKGTDSIAAFYGAMYSGNFYCPIDAEMPIERIQVIMGVLQPEAVITTAALQEKAALFVSPGKICLFEELSSVKCNEQLIQSISGNIIETDPAYVLFTSGSTGVPKGVLLPHRVLINYLHDLEKKFDINENDVFGNQAPLYFDISTHDIYGTAYFGAKMVIIPQHLFGFPVKLIEFLNEKRVSTFLWVPSAMGIVAKLKTFRAVKPLYLRHVMFAGEVLPKKQLDYWVENIPEATYANLYGPTETFVCTLYIQNGNEAEDAPLPIGRAVGNSETLILDEEGKAVEPGNIGELCLRGNCLALGYYNAPERTESAFVQNPMNSSYPDRIYHTGDLVRENEAGDILYVSRKDFQIKRMGYRIELGEIETAANLVDGIEECACTYLERRNRITLHYEGRELQKAELLDALQKRIPRYMMPDQIVFYPALPRNANGKIDRRALQIA